MFITPMLAESGDVPVDESLYWFEPKINGHRLILSFINGQVRLYTRYKQDVTRLYPELHNVPVNGGADIVLDGEVAYVNPETGVMEFETLIERFRMNREARIREGMKLWPVRFFIFDLLYYNGEDLREQPLSRRKRLLRDAVEENAFYRIVKYTKGPGAKLLDSGAANELSGIVAKRPDSLYVGGRSADWLKIVKVRHTDLHISGYRKGRFGLLGFEAPGSPPEPLELTVPKAFSRLFCHKARSFVTGEDTHYYYLDPLIKARVRFHTRKKDGRPYHPQFERFIFPAEPC